MDISRYGNNGAGSGVSSVATGIFGDALLFGRANSKVTTNAYSGSLVSLCGWFNFNGTASGRTGNTQGLISNRQSGSDVNWTMLYMSNSNVISYGCKNDTTENKVSYTFAVNNTWTYICGVTTDTEQKLYINAVNVANINKTRCYSNSKYPYVIGNYYDMTRGFTGRIDEVRIYNRSLTSAEIIFQFRSEFQKYSSTEYWFLDNIPTITQYTPLITPSTYLFTPTYDGSNQSVHPDVVRFESAWNGYRYWMIMTPFNGSDSIENPSILVCNDSCETQAAVWIVPPGLTNPIMNYSGVGSHNNDVTMMYHDNALWAYWLTDYDGYIAIRYSTSTDGINWAPNATIINLTPGSTTVAPSILKVNNTYSLYYGNSSCGWPLSHLMYYNSTDGLNFSGPYYTDFKPPTGYVMWHMNVDYIAAKNTYLMLYSAYPNTGDCSNVNRYYMATSGNGINWTTNVNPILLPNNDWTATWLHAITYLYDSSTDNLSIWYSAKGTSSMHIGFLSTQYNKLPDHNNSIISYSAWANDTSNNVVTTDNGNLRYLILDSLNH